MAVGDVVAQREEQVEGADHVGVLGLDGALAGHHRVGRRGLLAVVDDRFRSDLGDHLVEEVAVLDGADVAADLLTGDLTPGVDPLLEVADRGQRGAAVLSVPAAAGEVVENRHLVIAGREPQGRRPAQVAVAPKDENAHRRARVADRQPRAKRAGRLERHSIRPWPAGWRRDTGGERALPPWSRSCCSALACGSITPGKGGRPVYDAVAYAGSPRTSTRATASQLGPACHPAVEQLLARPAAVRGRRLRGHGGVHERLAR